jgi:hypothetical protein
LPVIRIDAGLPASDSDHRRHVDLGLCPAGKTAPGFFVPTDSRCREARSMDCGEARNPPEDTRHLFGICWVVSQLEL